MKRKALISGRNNVLLVDFIQHTSEFFNTLSTSECLQDIFGHFTVFDPDVYICFVDRDYERTISLIDSLKEDSCYNGAPIVFVGDSETCSLIEKKTVFTADILICRPVTPDNLILRITRYFDDVAEAKAKLRAKERALQNEAEAQKAAIEAKTAEIVAKETAAVPDSVEKKHILIVDDDRTVLKMLKSALGDSYEVTTMINGVMVDKLLDTKKVDLIILDYEMPIETGAEIFRRIKKNPKASHIPVCFLTGITDRQKILEVMALKPHGYLLKPIDMDMLSATIRNLTD